MATEQEIQAQGWIRAVRYTLIFTGVCYLLFIPIGPLMALTRFNDPHMSTAFNLGFGIGFSLIMFVICGGIAVLNFAAASGLRKGKYWAWIVGLVLGGLYAPSICLPLGTIILFGLLREDSRNLYLRSGNPR
jgi:hypothetical protein